MGPLRTIISFTLGMLIARLAPTKQRPPTFWAVLAGFFMVSMLTIQTPLSFRTPLDLAIILIVSPGLLIIGSRFEVPALFVSSAIRLGDLPFALYAIHLPFARGSQFVAHHFHFPPALLAPTLLPARSPPSSRSTARTAGRQAPIRRSPPALTTHCALAARPLASPSTPARMIASR